MNKPYVGITAVTSAAEAKAVANLFEKVGFEKTESHMPMIGVLMSYKTLEGKETNPRYPDKYDIPLILNAAKKRTFATIHYDSKNTERLSREIDVVLDIADWQCEGIQINQVWPSGSEIKRIKDEYPDIKLILGISQREGVSIDEMVSRVVSNYSCVDYLLIDNSRGRGIEMDVEQTAELYKKLRRAGVTATMGCAGGLSGENVYDLVCRLKNRLGTEKFSIDAQVRLRDKLSNMKDDDILNTQKALAYLEGAAKALLWRE